ncbi:hypothetical protein AGABI1DRAFT_111282, partial [Agaricus bisporus var. burnettii JB137-S8]
TVGEAANVSWPFLSETPLGCQARRAQTASQKLARESYNVGVLHSFQVYLFLCLLFSIFLVFDVETISECSGAPLYYICGKYLYRYYVNFYFCTTELTPSPCPYNTFR